MHMYLYLYVRVAHCRRCNPPHIFTRTSWPGVNTAHGNFYHPAEHIHNVLESDKLLIFPMFGCSCPAGVEGAFHKFKINPMDWIEFICEKSCHIAISAVLRTPRFAIPAIPKWSSFLKLARSNSTVHSKSRMAIQRNVAYHSPVGTSPLFLLVATTCYHPISIN